MAFVIRMVVAPGSGIVDPILIGPFADSEAAADWIIERRACGDEDRLILASPSDPGPLP